MESSCRCGDETCVQRQIDWMDVKFVCLLGVIMVVVKSAELGLPDLGIGRTTTDDVASILIVGYVLARARRQPEKLDDWGLTTRLSFPALLMGLALLGTSLLALAAGGIAVAGKLSFSPSYVPQMIEYILAAFPQQFAMCSVGLATLATLQPFRGRWRLPLVVGLAFSLAHFWTPSHIPGTVVPIQMPITFVAGFVASYYFLRFRSILPLTAIHAISYPLLHRWIEVHL